MPGIAVRRTASLPLAYARQSIYLEKSHVKTMDTRVKPAYDTSRHGDAVCAKIALVILQQPLDVIEFDLRALGIGEAAAEFFQYPAHPLHIDFAGNLHGKVIAEFTPV